MNASLRYMSLVYACATSWPGCVRCTPAHQEAGQTTWNCRRASAEADWNHLRKHQVYKMHEAPQDPLYSTRKPQGGIGDDSPKSKTSGKSKCLQIFWRHQLSNRALIRDPRPSKSMFAGCKSRCTHLCTCTWCRAFATSLNTLCWGRSAQKQSIQAVAGCYPVLDAIDKVGHGYPGIPLQPFQFYFGCLEDGLILGFCS